MVNGTTHIVTCDCCKATIMLFDDPTESAKYFRLAEWTMIPIDMARGKSIELCPDCKGYLINPSAEEVGMAFKKLMNILEEMGKENV